MVSNANHVRGNLRTLLGVNFTNLINSLSHTFAMHANAFCLQQRISSFLFVSVKEIDIKLMRSANILLIITQSDQHCTQFRFLFMSIT